jgi:V/A-type H+-transporting ATPase subunit A
MEVEPLDNNVQWHFTPVVKAGDEVSGGSVLGHVPEKLFQHKIFVPFPYAGKFTIGQRLLTRATTP